MTPVHLLVLACISGILIKITDDIIDEKWNVPLVLLLAIKGAILYVITILCLENALFMCFMLAVLYGSYMADRIFNRQDRIMNDAFWDIITLYVSCLAIYTAIYKPEKLEWNSNYLFVIILFFCAIIEPGTFPEEHSRLKIISRVFFIIFCLFILFLYYCSILIENGTAMATALVLGYFSTSVFIKIASN
jgi:hypothetical protein